MKNIVEKTFESGFLLEDIRQIWRETAPLHQLSKKEKEKVSQLILKIKKNLKVILEEIRA